VVGSSSFEDETIEFPKVYGRAGSRERLDAEVHSGDSVRSALRRRAGLYTAQQKSPVFGQAKLRGMGRQP
jgi:hypothetical protein